MSPRSTQLADLLKKIEGGQDVLDAMERELVEPPAETETARKIREKGDLMRLESAGVVRRGSGKLPANFWTLRRPDDPNDSLRRALGEDRKQTPFPLRFWDANAVVPLTVNESRSGDMRRLLVEDGEQIT